MDNPEFGIRFFICRFPQAQCERLSLFQPRPLWLKRR
jgi:hypothetical protein